ncbi:MAG TPA: YhbY family RNA-binding protein [Xanthomonadales bacterium]|nr:YhbY family RNA-binding protein [Xanthomonadales bacterium]
MALKNAQKRYLRGLTHGLNPVVMIAERGLAPSVLKEMEIALDHHELIKVRISAADRDARDALVAEMLAATNAELIHKIGHVVSIWRRNNAHPKIELP